MTLTQPTQPSRRTVETHRAEVLALVETLPDIQLRLHEALGLTLAADVNAKLAVPPFTNSAMDGFAVRVAEVAEASPDRPVSLRVTADIPAGEVSGQPITEGTAQRIMTGALLPDGADAVVPVEDTDHGAGAADLPPTVLIYAPAQPGQNIRRAGENTQVDEVIMTQGQTLDAAGLAAAASVGYGSLRVYERPRVTVIATGSELTAPGIAPKPGCIPDSNGVMLAGLVLEFGAQVAQLLRVDDDPEQFRSLLGDVVGESDLIITAGGVSAGAFEVVKTGSLDSDMTFVKVAMQPGKPQGFGLLRSLRDRAGGREVLLLALPGNPIGAYVSFHTFVRPLLAKLAGADPDAAPRTGKAIAAVGWRAPAGRRQHVPVKITAGAPGELPSVTPTHLLGSGSHLIATLHTANGLAVVGEDLDGVAPGDEVGLLYTTPTACGGVGL